MEVQRLQLRDTNGNPITRPEESRLYYGLTRTESSLYDTLLGRKEYGEGEPLTAIEDSIRQLLFNKHREASDIRWEELNYEATQQREQPFS